MKPKLSALQTKATPTIGFKSIKQGRRELKRIEQQIYTNFLSDTERRRRRRRGEEVPPQSDCVSTTLSAKWRSYTGYCPRSLGEALLNEQDAIVRALNEVKERRSVRLRQVRTAEQERKQREQQLRAEWSAYLSHFTPDDQLWLQNADLKCFGMWWLCAKDHELFAGSGRWTAWAKSRRLPQSPQELLFMRGLAANPDEVTTWLGYADWLDAHGQVVFSAHPPGELANKIRRHVESCSAVGRGEPILASVPLIPPPAAGNHAPPGGVADNQQDSSADP